MPSEVAHSPTQVIIVAQAALYRAAWTALLSPQPDIVVAGASGGISEIAPLLQPGRPTTLLLDLPPLPPLIQQLKTLPAEKGRFLE